MTSGWKRVGDESTNRVYQALEHEADLDGLCTASAERLGELAGLSQISALAAVHKLANQGRVRLLVHGRGQTLTVQIEEFA